MDWFFLCFIPPFLWGVNTVIDQYLSRRYFVGQSTALQGFQGVLTCVSGVLILALFPGLEWVWQPICLALVAGAVLNFSYVPYMKALQGDDVTLVVSLFQLLPVGVFVGEWLLLDGGATWQQAAASMIVIAASIALIWDHKIRRFKLRPLFLMGVSCIGITVFILMSRELVGSLHWLHIAGLMGIGAGLSSAILFLQDAKRIGFTKRVIQDNPVRIVALAVGQELFSRAAMAIFQFVMIGAASVALAQTVISGMQPIYVLIMGGIAWMMAKDIYDKPDWRGHSLQKLLCILVMLGGLALLYQLI